MNDNHKILVIDDDPVVHKLLEAMLRNANYDVAEAFSGEKGLESASFEKPDLILLDIMMPLMNGYEVIKRLKADQKTKEIPVIFLSAKAESSDKVLGLELGAADFVNKPFDRAELLARIKTQIRLKEQEEKLKEYSQNLEEMVEERTQQLIHADRLASLGTLSAGIAHEINNPTTFITGNIHILEQFWKKILEYLTKIQAANEDEKLDYVITEFPALLKSIRMGADRITNIVAGLKAFSRKEKSIKGSVSLENCIEEALNLTSNRLKYHVTIEKTFEPNLPPIWANAQQLVQVFVNLMVNAADAIGNRNGLLKISAKSLPNETVQVTFADNGPGMPASIINKIFDPFFTTKSMGEGTGLGLSITHGIISDHAGKINVSSIPGKGATFIITLPMESSFK